MNARTRFWLTTVAALLAVAATLSLGRWQLARATYKESLQTAMQTQSAKVVLNAADLVAATDPQALVYQTARVQGTWLPEKTVFLDNRQMQGHVGFFVLTPLLLQGSSAVLLVQRGWAPRNFEDRSRLPSVETPRGVVEVQGHIALSPGRLYELGTAGAGAIRQNLDLVQFKAESGLPLLAMTLQQTGAASEGLLRDWPAVNLGVDKHYGYAFQWFGLAALFALLYLWFHIVRRFIYPPKDTHLHG